MQKQFYLVATENNSSHIFITDDKMKIAQVIEENKKNTSDLYGQKVLRRVFKLSGIQEVDLSTANFSVDIKE